MRNHSKKTIVTALILLKLAISLLIIAFPQLVDIAGPFSVYTPIFLFSLVYTGISEWSTFLLGAAIIAMVAIVIICPVLLLSNRSMTGVATAALQLLFMFEILCLMVSLMVGDTLIKLCGVILNVMIADMLIEIRQDGA